MNKVYKHRRLATDEYLGRVDADGRVYESRTGPDKYIGRVEIETGKIYESRLGPDKHIGRVELDSGKVFLSRLGPDEYLGRVHGDGKVYHHQSLSPDQYLGKVVDMVSFAHGGAAFLLLIQPVYDEAEVLAQEKKEEKDADDLEAGQATSPA